MPVVVMLIFASTRWPGLMPMNFSAAYGLAFCAGVYFPGRLAWLLPLVTLFGTDLLINRHYGVPFFTPYLFVNSIAYCAMIWLGRRFSASSSWLKLLGGGIISAFIFYFVSNTASWIYDPAYPKTFSGWVQALTTGTPGWPHTWEFFRNTLMSGGLFTGLFAGAMKLGEAADEQESEETEPEAAPEPVEAEA
jgi:hypothetical protein